LFSPGGRRVSRFRLRGGPRPRAPSRAGGRPGPTSSPGRAAGARPCDRSRLRCAAFRGARRQSTDGSRQHVVFRAVLGVGTWSARSDFLPRAVRVRRIPRPFAARTEEPGWDAGLFASGSTTSVCHAMGTATSVARVEQSAAPCASPEAAARIRMVRLLDALPLIVHNDSAADVVRAAARPRSARRSYQRVESSPARSAFSASASAQPMRSISWDEKWGLSTSDALTRSFS
jgi:hypothetical protein